MKTKALKQHPLSKIIPPLTDEERSDLHQSIANNGPKIPIMLFEGQILDG
jgi:hypothetical protein